MIDNTQPTFDSLRLFPYDTRYTPATPPLVGVFDPPTYSVCINAQWLSHVDGVIDRLLWRDAWEGAPEEQQRAADEAINLLRAIATATPCGDTETMFRLRQNPSNPCILEQSFNGGVSWSTAFDYALCKQSSGVDINLGITIVDNDVTIYNGNPSGFEPQLQDSDPFTDAAVCYALEVVIRAALAGILERVKSNNQQALIIQAVGSAIGIVATFTFGPIGAGIAVAIGTSIGLIASAIINELEEAEIEAVINSDVAILELVCCAYETLAGFRPIPALFDDVLDSCPELSSTAAAVVPALQPVFDDFETFVEFLRVAGQAYEYAEQGLLGDSCANCGGVWCYRWLGGFGWSPAWTILAWNGGSATYDAVNDRLIGYKNPPSSGASFIDITFTVNAIVTFFEVGINWNATRASNTDFVQILYDGVEVVNVDIGPSGDTQTVYSTPEGQFVGTIRVRAVAAVQSQGDAGFMRITRLILEGLQENPIGPDNCP